MSEKTGHHLTFQMSVVRVKETKEFERMGFDYVRGSTYEIKLIVKNNGPSTFPGGQLTNFGTDYISVTNLNETWTISERNIPKLVPEQDFEVKEPFTWTPIADGPTWFRINAESIDKKQIYYTTQSSTDRTDFGLQYVYVADRESVFILRELLRRNKGSSRSESK